MSFETQMVLHIVAKKSSGFEIINRKEKETIRRTKRTIPQKAVDRVKCKAVETNTKKKGRVYKRFVTNGRMADL
ncbi:hypothetical protein OUZ56_001892 [Daphnia magna]|uniref:Uncharacterized protein n=1 Tax=Daphnia magna TaxID=35525 RepID=A0ABR0A422_9CRUS|nr:hypothetical protein OUZ56_001892 [Daphnia magna]